MCIRDRYKEDEIDKDKKDGIKAEARYTSLNDMYELWRDLKRGIKNNTCLLYTSDFVP